MNRSEIRDIFRSENPDITERVLSDTVLNNWCKLGDKEICAKTRCIVTNESEEFTSTEDAWHYDLSSQIDKFYDIDDFPGGGVYYDDDPLDKLTPARMNTLDSTWKSRSSGAPTYYWRRGKYLWFDRPNEASITIAVDCVLVSDPFDSDSKSPYNSLEHLEPFHEAVLKFLLWKAKKKIGKDQEAEIALRDYQSYLSDMRKQIRAYQQGHSQMRIRMNL